MASTRCIRPMVSKQSTYLFGPLDWKSDNKPPWQVTLLSSALCLPQRASIHTQSLSYKKVAWSCNSRV